MTKNQNQEVPVAEIEVGGNILFNNTVNDIVVEDSNGPLPESVSNLVDPDALEKETEETVDQVEQEDQTDEVDKTVDTDDADNTEEVEETVESNETEDTPTGKNYDDYSESALYATALKEQVPTLFPEDIDKDLKPEDLITNLVDFINGQVQGIQNNVASQYQEASQYLDLLLNSGNRERTDSAVSSAANYDTYALMEIDDNTSEEQLENIIKEDLKLKGVSSRIITSTIEDLKDTGELRSEAANSQNTFKERRENIIASEKAAQEREAVEYQMAMKAQEDEFNRLVDSGSLNGISLNKKEQEDFKRWMGQEIVVEDVDPNTGQKVRYKTTKSRQALADFNNNFEKVLAFNKLLMDGFDFTNIQNKAKKERDGEVLRVLNNRTNKNKSQTNNSNNPWLGS